MSNSNAAGANNPPPPPMATPTPRRAARTPQLGELHQSSNRNLTWVGGSNGMNTNELHRLFCILMIAVKLETHRVRLQKRLFSFTTNDAFQKLEKLKFVHTNKRYSPEDPSILLLTTLVTTYAMPTPMARLLCGHFLAARLVESCEGKTDFMTVDSVWQPTPKGISLLQAFSARNGITTPHVVALLDSPFNNLRLINLERQRGTDQILDDKGTAEVLFRRFVGTDGPGADSDSSIHDAAGNTVPARLIAQRRVGNRTHSTSFTGRSCLDWLMRSCTFNTDNEATGMAARFVALNLCELLTDDKNLIGKPGFSTSKHANYRVTMHGMQVASWWPRKPDENGSDSPKSTGTARDSNRARMLLILNSPPLRLLFREFLRDTHCEENFIFFTEVDDYLFDWQSNSSPLSSTITVEKLRETLAGSYDLYNAFLAPGSPCELNIDHSLRYSLMRRMTNPELPEHELRNAVEETVQLFTEAKNSIFKLMASDSVPKFLKEPRYADFLEQTGVHEALNGHHSANNVTVEMTKLTL